MFSRDTPRSFVRFPQNVFEYIRQGNGSYTQISSTTVLQAASSSKTGRDSLLNSNYNFAGGWQPLHNSALSWWLRGGRPVDGSRDSNLSTDIGSLLHENRGGGFSMSFDQQFGPFTPFLRFSIADSEITSIKRFVSLGAVYQAPLKRPWDALGIGIASGDPSAAEKREETLLEVFWRFQLNPLVAITPDIQLVFNPSDNPASDQIVVAGIRLQLDF